LATSRFISDQTISTVDLDMRIVTAKFAPKLFNQKQNRKQIATKGNIFETIITGGESWVHEKGIIFAAEDS